MAVGLSFGLVYGQGNHNTYLLYGLRQLNPEVLQHDWLAASTTHYHQSFALVMRALSWLGPLPWSIDLTNVSLIAAVLVATYGFLVRDFGSSAFSAICLLMFIVALDGTYSVGSSHILTLYLRTIISSFGGGVWRIAAFLAGEVFLVWPLVSDRRVFPHKFLLLDLVFSGQ